MYFTDNTIYSLKETGVLSYIDTSAIPTYQINCDSDKIKQLYFTPQVGLPANYSFDEFLVRFSEHTCGLFGSSFPWNCNVIIAGGSINKLVSKDISMAKLSDIDIYLLHGENVKSNFKKVVEYLSSIDANLQYVHNSRIVNLKTSIFNRTIQLIFSDKDNADDIVRSFDMTHCSIYYDGNDVYFTGKYKDSLQSRITSAKLRTYQPRYVKAIQGGYRIFHKPYRFVILPSDLGHSLTDGLDPIAGKMFLDDDYFDERVGPRWWHDDDWKNVECILKDKFAYADASDDCYVLGTKDDTDLVDDQAELWLKSEECVDLYCYPIVLKLTKATVVDKQHVRVSDDQREWFESMLTIFRNKLYYKKKVFIKYDDGVFNLSESKYGQLADISPNSVVDLSVRYQVFRCQHEWWLRADICQMKSLVAKSFDVSRY